MAQLHEQLAWEARRAASEKGALAEDDVRDISLATWLEAIRRCTGKEVEVVSKK